jgi:hypothetical protein
MANWNIANLEYTNDADKGVTIAHWRVTAEDGEYSASSYGTTSFTPDASAEGYVAYESLTEETVLGWVKEQLDVEAIESALADNIAAQKAPATLAGMPWVTEEAA